MSKTLNMHIYIEREINNHTKTVSLQSLCNWEKIVMLWINWREITHHFFSVSMVTPMVVLLLLPPLLALLLHIFIGIGEGRQVMRAWGFSSKNNKHRLMIRQTHKDSTCFRMWIHVNIKYLIDSNTILHYLLNTIIVL